MLPRKCAGVFSMLKPDICMESGLYALLVGLCSVRNSDSACRCIGARWLLALSSSSASLRLCVASSHSLATCFDAGFVYSCRLDTWCPRLQCNHKVQRLSTVAAGAPDVHVSVSLFVEFLALARQAVTSASRNSLLGSRTTKMPSACAEQFRTKPVALGVSLTRVLQGAGKKIQVAYQNTPIHVSVNAS